MHSNTSNTNIMINSNDNNNDNNNNNIIISITIIIIIISGAEELPRGAPVRNPGARGPHAGHEARGRVCPGAEGAGDLGQAEHHEVRQPAPAPDRGRQVRQPLCAVQEDQRAAPGATSGCGSVTYYD